MDSGLKLGCQGRPGNRCSSPKAGAVPVAELKDKVKEQLESQARSDLVKD